MVPVAKAFDMDVIAWSQNLTEEAASAVGARRVEKDELFRRSDIVSIHVVLGERTRGLVGAPELALMKQGALLVNTARGPIVDEGALLEALDQGRIRAARRPSAPARAERDPHAPPRLHGRGVLRGRLSGHRREPDRLPRGGSAAARDGREQLQLAAAVSVRAGRSGSAGQGRPNVMRRCSVISSMA
jgi:hypothetical protein